MLTQQQIAHFKAALLREEERISGQVDTLSSALSENSLTESVGELSAYDNHTSDLGSETFEREKDLGLIDNLQILHQQIEEALAKIEAGTYGICLVCGRDIPRERLEVVPYASTCVEHADDEFTRTSEHRPIEEEILSPPFARTFWDIGEDMWQAVARYGTANSPQDIPDAIGYDETYINADEDIGIVEGTDAIIDTAEEPARNLERKPHKQRFHGGRS